MKILKPLPGRLWSSSCFLFFFCTALRCIWPHYPAAAWTLLQKWWQADGAPCLWRCEWHLACTRLKILCRCLTPESQNRPRHEHFHFLFYIPSFLWCAESLMFHTVRSLRSVKRHRAFEMFKGRLQVLWRNSFATFLLAVLHMQAYTCSYTSCYLFYRRIQIKETAL